MLIDKPGWNREQCFYEICGYTTEVMGASFRNAGEITGLAGCDLLTISPNLLGELEKMDGELVKKLDETKAADAAIEKLHVDERLFRWMMNENAMATEKLAEGIRRFSADLIKLEQFVAGKF